MAHHELDADVVHARWDNALEPRLEVEPGDTVTLQCREAFGGQITPEAGHEVWRQLEFSRAHALTGPISVAGAQPGDTLAVEVLAFRHEGWGWTGFLPGKGLLREDFDYPYLQHWRIEDGSCRFRDGDEVDVPLEPFCGVMGVALAEPGPHVTFPPRHNGGNVDVRGLRTGARAYLPVLVPGALFSAGDCHAAQGDGEVCVSAIEAPMTVTLRLDLRKDLEVEELAFSTPSPLTAADREGYYCTTGHGDDLYLCAQRAVRRMIAWLQENYALSASRAYCLCSVAGDLRISEIVSGSMVVSFYMPLSVLRGSSA